MQPEYQNVVDISTVVPAMLAVAIHAAIAAIEVALAIYLLIPGGYVLLSSMSGSEGKPRRNAVVRTVLGVMLLLPTIARAPWFVSLVACTGTFAIFLLLLSGSPPAPPGAEDCAGGRAAWRSQQPPL